jgi:hypothetical protein
MNKLFLFIGGKGEEGQDSYQESTNNINNYQLSNANIDHRLPLLANITDKYQSIKDKTSSNNNTISLPISSGITTIPAINPPKNIWPALLPMADNALKWECLRLGII